MPFGIQLKGVIIGILLAYFGIPFITGLLNRQTAQPKV